MIIETKYGAFSVSEHSSKNPDEIILKVDGCRHVIQDSLLVERNPDDSISEPALATLGEIVIEDHVEFCQHRQVESETGVSAFMAGLGLDFDDLIGG